MIHEEFLQLTSVRSLHLLKQRPLRKGVSRVLFTYELELLTRLVSKRIDRRQVSMD